MLDRLLRLLPLETLQGYENPELIEVVFQKTLSYEPSNPWPEMEGVSSVLDFGGACGRHYKEAKIQSIGIRWAVVETPAMVARAKELETQQLRFFTDIRNAADWLGRVDLVHSNGAIQYVPDPLNIIRQLCAVRAARLLWSRVLLGSGETKKQVSLLAENGPGRAKTALKKIAYDRTPLNEADFISAHVGYKIEDRGKDWFKFTR